MAKEIERKFLVISDSFKTNPDNVSEIAQGYLSTIPTSTVRVRLKDDRAYLTVKGINNGPTRNEWEYEIPASDARDIIANCIGEECIVKTRYRVGRWEVDEFHGRYEGLVVAEIELSWPDEEFDQPDFVGKEVTGDPRYYNSSLINGAYGVGELMEE